MNGMALDCELFYVFITDSDILGDGCLYCIELLWMKINIPLFLNEFGFDLFEIRIDQSGEDFFGLVIGLREPLVRLISLGNRNQSTLLLLTLILLVLISIFLKMLY